MKPISKEEFSVILEQQQESGLSIKDFCSNESYPVSSFHYWKSKFGFTRTIDTPHRQSLPDKLAPVNINLPVKNPVTSSALQDGNKGEIKIKFPGGIQVSFTGSAQGEIAFHILHQICSAHVLSECTFSG